MIKMWVNSKKLLAISSGGDIAVHNLLDTLPLVIKGQDYYIAPLQGTKVIHYILTKEFPDIAINTSELVDQILNKKLLKEKVVEDCIDFSKYCKKTPYPFQAIGATYLTRIKRGLLCDSVGLGKSLQALLAAKYLYDNDLEVKKAQQPVLILCPPHLVKKWGDEVDKFIGDSYVRVSNKYVPKKMSPPSKGRKVLYAQKAVFKIVSYDLLRMDKAVANKLLTNIGVLICDECFPYETKVITSEGIKCIGDIVRDGKNISVLSFNHNTQQVEFQPIIATSEKYYHNNMVKLNCGGKEIVCTEVHKIYTKERGYINAKEISVGETVCTLREELYAESIQSYSSKILFKKLLRKVENATTRNQSKNLYKRYNQKNTRNKTNKLVKKSRKKTSIYKYNVSKIARTQSYAYGWNKRKSSGNKSITRKRSYSSYNKGRKWETNGSNASVVIRNINANGDNSYSRISSKNYKFSGGNKKSPYSLQYRFSYRGWANSYRSRWVVSLWKEKRTGYSEGYDINSVRVESIEIFKSRGDERFSTSNQEDSRVYNLQVAGNHNYFANDILVSNCQYIKSCHTKRHRNTYAHSTHAKYFFGLSATPIEKGPVDLYNVFKMIKKEFFGDRELYYDRYLIRGRYQEILGYKNIEELQLYADPYILRRDKEEVSSDMPSVVEQNLYFELTTEQAKLYKSLKNKTIQAFETGGDYADGIFDDEKIIDSLHSEHVIVLMHLLRKCCLSAELITPTCTDSSKLNALLEVIESVGESKIVIFCFYKKMVEIIARHLEDNGIPALWVHGDKSSEVNDILEKFTPESKYKVLVTSDILKEGHDLLTANYIINFDIPMSSTVYIQRCGRIDRIGQVKKTVYFINMICEDTIENDIYTSLIQKMVFFKNIFSPDFVSSRITVEDIRGFLNAKAVTTP